MADQPFIEFKGVRKAFGPKIIYSGLNLSIAKGEVLTICGGSGVGKSVMLKMLIGLLRADATGHFVAEAVDVAVAAKRLAEHGLEPRHLRTFRTAADREIGLVDQVLATRRGNGSRDDRTTEILSACIALHTALVRTGLAR